MKARAAETPVQRVGVLSDVRADELQRHVPVELLIVPLGLAVAWLEANRFQVLAWSSRSR